MDDIIKHYKFTDRWENERAFTEWLVDNPQHLNAATSIQMENLCHQKRANRGWCDVRATEVGTKRSILIEAQRGRADGDHFLKLFRYDNAEKADVIIWIVEEANDEHGSIIDKINEVDPRFWLIDLRLIGIGNLVAPEFRVLARPKTQEMKNTLSEVEAIVEEVKPATKSIEDYAKFFAAKIHWNEAHPTTIKWHKPSKHAFIHASAGKENVEFFLTVSKQRTAIGLEVKRRKSSDGRLVDQLPVFEFLLDRGAKIEEEFGHRLIWDSKPGKAQRQIRYEIPIDFREQRTLEYLFNWIDENSEHLYAVLAKYIREYKLSTKKADAAR